MSTTPGLEAERPGAARSRRRICVATGSRADYGLLRYLLEDIRDDPRLELQVVATGTHLSPEFGLTYRAIEEDGFAIDAKVEMLLSSDTPVGIAKSIGLATIGFADALDRLRPDVLVVLGDRFETLAAAQAAMVAGIPIAHIQGGELTEGLIDEAIRHAVTKMAHLHFVSAEPYRERVIQLGEAPERVLTVGATNLDARGRFPLLDRPALERELGLALGEPTFLITYHSVTLGGRRPERAVESLLAALDRFPAATLVFTGHNADAGGRAIGGAVAEYCRRHAGRARFFVSLGQRRYWSVLAQADVVIGNSSSGLIEAPAVGKPTVNLGDRQRGRLRGASVIDCEESAAAIEAAIRRALSPAFHASLAGQASPYGEGGAAPRIKEALATADLDGILLKRFHDLPRA